jgi:transposase
MPSLGGAGMKRPVSMIEERNKSVQHSLKIVGPNGQSRLKTNHGFRATNVLSAGEVGVPKVPLEFALSSSRNDIAPSNLAAPDEPDNFFSLRGTNINAPTGWYSGDVKVFRNQPQKGAFMYKYHIGVDYHKKYSYIVVKDTQGQVLRSGQVINTKQSVKNFLGPFCKEGHAVVEATRNWQVIYDWLEQMLGETVLANPLKVKAIAEAKIKTDKIDGNVLSDLLRADLLPTAHVPSPKARTMRLALRERMFFVRLRTMAKNRVYTAFDRYPEQRRQLKSQTDLFGKEGRKQLKAIKVSEIDRILIDRELGLIDDLNGYIKESENTIKQYSRGNADVNRLKSLPGIGEFFARLIEAEIDGIDRFRHHKKLAAYAGLVPSTYSSGGKTFHGRIIKGGNKWLRWAFVEAVIPAVRKDPILKLDYESIKKKKGYNKAKVAIARKLLILAYRVLKEKRNYRAPNKQEVEMKQLLRLS